MSRKPIAEIRKEIAQFRARANKAAKGSPVVSSIEDVPNTYFLRRPSGIMQLDIDTGGGLPAGGLSYLSGPDNCLAGDTLVHHEVRNRDGVRTTRKWVSLARLYERFHRLPSGKVGRTHLLPEGHTFHVPSMNDAYGIVQNKIVDVVSCGRKECFELTTRKGYRIVATGLHKFFDGKTYRKLSSLIAGDTVYIHNNTRRERLQNVEAKPSRNFLYVKHHPTAYKKKIHDRTTGKLYEYHVLPRARAVVEASMNNLSLAAYLEILNSKTPKVTAALQPEQVVHHVDEDVQNDALENLAVVTRAERMLEHLKHPDRDNDFRFMAIEDTVLSIVPAGTQETYDIKMASPFHNYVANNFVVHNSGKSYLLAKYFAMNQRLYGEKSSLAIGLSEGAPDHWFWRKAGVQVAIPDAMIEEEMKYRKERNLKPFTKEEHKDLKKQVGEIVVLRHATGEKLLQTVIEAIETGVFDFVGLDSVSALLSESESGKELDENPQQAAVATSMTRFFQHYLTSTTGFYGRNDTTVVFTAQARSNRKKSEAAAHFAKYMKDWTTSGSWAARHGKLIDITVWSGGKEKEEVLINGKKQRVAMGKDICWEISKGKAGTHDGITGEVEFSYDTMTDDLQSIVSAGFRYGSIQEKAGLVTVCRGTGEPVEGLVDLAGIDRLIAIMKEDFEVELFIRREVLAASGIRCTYR